MKISDAFKITRPLSVQDSRNGDTPVPSDREIVMCTWCKKLHPQHIAIIQWQEEKNGPGNEELFCSERCAREYEEDKKELRKETELLIEKDRENLKEQYEDWRK